MNETDQEKIFFSVYLVFGLLITIVSLIFTFQSVPTLRDKSLTLPGFKSSQILIIIGGLYRGIGYIIYAALILIVNGVLEDEKYKYISPILNGFPGYVLVIAYCMMFFLWCSIAANLLFNDSTDFYDRLKKRMTLLLIFVTLLGITLIIVLVSNAGNKAIANSEIWLAFVRDVITSLFFIYHLRNIIQNLRQPLCSSANESVLSIMSIIVIIAMLYRAVSIGIYYHLYDTNKVTSGGALANTIICMILSELMPILMILITRKKSGLLSVYNSI